MHFSFWEKAGFAVLVAAWVTWGTNQVGNMLVHADSLHENAFKIEVADSGGNEGGAKKEAEPEKPIGELLAEATPEAGEKVFKKCASCHDASSGGPNKVGPNLWNVVGAKHAHVDSFAYSDVMKGMSDKVWSFEELDHFLASPRDYAPGTKMTFAGLKKASDRAAVILYLRGQADNPIPLP